MDLEGLMTDGFMTDQLMTRMEGRTGRKDVMKGRHERTS